MDERMRCVISDIDYCRDDSLLLMVAVLHKLSVFSLSLCVSVCVCVCRQPWYYGWGFNLPRGQALLDKWNQVPDNTDILVTHCPPLGETLITEHTHARARTYTHTHTHTHTMRTHALIYICMGSRKHSCKDALLMCGYINNKCGYWWAEYYFDYSHTHMHKD